MRHTVPPPFHPHCDWTNNIHHCEDSAWHQAVTAAAVCVHLVVAIFGVVLLWQRQRYLWSARARAVHPTHPKSPYCCLYGWLRRPVDGMIAGFVLFMLTRTVYFMLTLLDVLPGLAVREPLFALSYLPGFYATLIITAGVIRAVSPVLRNGEHLYGTVDTSSSGSVPAKRWLSLRPPRARPVLYVLGILALLVPSVATVTGALAGRGADRGQWQRYLSWHRACWLGWALVMGMIAALGACYFAALSMLLRRRDTLLAAAFTGSSERAAESARSDGIRRLKRALFIEVILTSTAAVVGVVGALTKVSILTTAWVGDILEVITLVVCWPAFVLAILSRIHWTAPHLGYSPHHTHNGTSPLATARRGGDGKVTPPSPLRSQLLLFDVAEELAVCPAPLPDGTLYYPGALEGRRTAHTPEMIRVEPPSPPIAPLRAASFHRQPTYLDIGATGHSPNSLTIPSTYDALPPLAITLSTPGTPQQHSYHSTAQFP